MKPLCLTLIAAGLLVALPCGKPITALVLILAAVPVALMARKDQ